MHHFSYYTQPTSKLLQPITWLYGHNGSINGIAICRDFRVVVSYSADGTCILWDLNSFSYVRVIAEHEKSIECCCISPTLGDIASCSATDAGGSFLMVNTINGAKINAFSTDRRITALCYSSRPEGISVNALLTGFEDGTIKFWSSWDLAPFRTLSTDNISLPVRWYVYLP